VRTGGDAGSRAILSNSANSYSGSTTVTSGLLLLENVSGSATGTGNITVNTGATLGGNGRATGSATVNGLLAPGTGVGDLELGSLTMASTSQLTLEIDPALNAADAVITQGGVSIASGATLQLSFVGVSAGPYTNTFVVVNNKSTAVTAGTFNTTPATGGILQYTVNYGVNWDGDGVNNDITITFNSVPEPGMLSLLGVGSVWLLRRRRA
jgi:autotransporter-associated beta strand protein